jgi:hypothetical protein
LLGSTYATTFTAPAGFDSYRVKYLAPDGEHDVNVPCVFVQTDPPKVRYSLSC